MGQPLLDWIATSLPATRPTLRAPASEDALARVGEVLGHPLPAALAALYGAHDGQNPGPAQANVFEAFRWLPLAECVAQRALFTEVAEQVQREYPSAPSWRAAWLPFAGDNLGNVWVVDLMSGCVFEFDHAEGEGAELGESFESFLAGYLESFTSGERVIDPELGVMRLPVPAMPRAVAPRRRALVLLLVAAYAIALLVFVVVLELRRHP